MAEDTRYAPGSFCWLELGTTNAADAKTFYVEVFPWTFEDHEMPDGGPYTMINVGDKGVAGMYTMPAEMAQMNIPPHWMSYVAVEDADAVAARVTELGGTVMKYPFDVMEMGRMAVCMDPTGAAFSLWQPLNHQGATQGDPGPGTRCWNELVSRNVEASRDFFVALFGWEAEKQQMGPMEYTLFSQGEQQVAGMMEVAPEMGEMPSAWIAYLVVDDCDARVARATEAGGKALMPPMDLPEIGRTTWLQDPQGAVLGILQPAVND